MYLLQVQDLCELELRGASRVATRFASRFAWGGRGRFACLSPTICLLKPHDLPPELPK
jgi:hypothetical protein